MGCSCNKNKSNSEIPLPLDLEWGPALWLLLHSLAEKSGKNDITAKHLSHITGWKNLIKNLQTIIPCQECKQHFLEYKIEHPFPDVPYSELNTTVRTWLWELHANVNERKGVPNSVSMDDLAERYGSTDLRVAYYTVKSIMIKFFKTPLVSIINWHIAERAILAILTSI